MAHLCSQPSYMRSVVFSFASKCAEHCLLQQALPVLNLSRRLWGLSLGNMETQLRLWPAEAVPPRLG